MKAVIVDIQGRYVAALTEKGTVERIPNNQYEIGQTIELHEMKPVKTRRATRRLGTGLAAVLAAAMLGTGVAYAMPYGTVTLEGESSIEYTINCFDYVLDVKATDEEGEALLSELGVRQLRHRKVERAVTETLERMEQPEELSIRADTGSERHSERLRRELEPLTERPEGQLASETTPDTNKEESVDSGESLRPQEEQTQRPGQTPRENAPQPDAPEQNQQPPEDGQEGNAPQTGSMTVPPEQPNQQPIEGAAQEGNRQAALPSEGVPRGNTPPTQEN